MLKIDPNTGERLYDVELHTDVGGVVLVEDLIEMDAVWLMNAVDTGYGYDAGFGLAEFHLGDFTEGSRSFTVNNERLVLALLRA